MCLCMLSKLLLSTVISPWHLQLTLSGLFWRRRGVHFFLLQQRQSSQDWCSDLCTFNVMPHPSQGVGDWWGFWSSEEARGWGHLYIGKGRHVQKRRIRNIMLRPMTCIGLKVFVYTMSCMWMYIWHVCICNVQSWMVILWRCYNKYPLPNIEGGVAKRICT